MSAESNNSALIRKYVKEMKTEFRSDIQKQIFGRLHAKHSWKDIHKTLKYHLSRLLEQTDDYKNLELLLENRKSELRDIESSIVNKTYKIVLPFVERLAKEEAENKKSTRRSYPASLLKRSFALQYLTRRKRPTVTRPGSAPKPMNVNMAPSRSKGVASALNMRSLMNALNGI